MEIEMMFAIFVTLMLGMSTLCAFWYSEHD
ncbi:hypothetical protein GGQ71_003906 [Rhizobium taibaishanense]|uniref:Uncharacterized protein n=1 Tax=Allorhizobium taibaishanense TaxID=887144 RepID=A0A7W6MVY2_9HYPH|nr:hypothetical protein [Allorhizobium taibaishanense]